MKFIIFVMLFVLSGCSGRISSTAVNNAIKVCIANDGLNHINPDLGTIDYVIKCKNGATFFSRDVFKNKS